MVRIFAGCQTQEEAFKHFTFTHSDLAILPSKLANFVCTLLMSVSPTLSANRKLRQSRIGLFKMKQDTFLEFDINITRSFQDLNSGFGNFIPGD